MLHSLKSRFINFWAGPKEQLKEMAEYRLENRNTGAGTSTSPATGGQLGR